MKKMETDFGIVYEENLLTHDAARLKKTYELASRPEIAARIFWFAGFIAVIVGIVFLFTEEGSKYSVLRTNGDDFKSLIYTARGIGFIGFGLFLGLFGHFCQRMKPVTEK